MGVSRSAAPSAGLTTPALSRAWGPRLQGQGAPPGGAPAAPPALYVLRTLPGRSLNLSGAGGSLTARTQLPTRWPINASRGWGAGCVHTQPHYPPLPREARREPPGTEGARPAGHGPPACPEAPAAAVPEGAGRPGPRHARCAGVRASACALLASPRQTRVSWAWAGRGRRGRGAGGVGGARAGPPSQGRGLSGASSPQVCRGPWALGTPGGRLCVLSPSGGRSRRRRGRLVPAGVPGAVGRDTVSVSPPPQWGHLPPISSRPWWSVQATAGA